MRVRYRPTPPLNVQQPVRAGQEAASPYASMFEADLFDYIECVYNPKPRHSTIGYLSPMEFEMKAGLAYLTQKDINSTAEKLEFR